MKHLAWLFLVLSACGTVSCATNSVTVLQRASELSSRPEWADVTQSVQNQGDKTFFLGYVELGVDSSKSAAMNMSDQKAYSAPMDSMVDAFFQQNSVAEDLRQDSSISELVMSSARNSRPPMPGLRVAKRYWEVIEVKSAVGLSYQLHVFSLAEIPTSEYEKAKRAVLARLNGNKELKNVLKEVSKTQRDQLLNQEPKAEQ